VKKTFIEVADDHLDGAMHDGLRSRAFADSGVHSASKACAFSEGDVDFSSSDTETNPDTNTVAQSHFRCYNVMPQEIPPSISTGPIRYH